MKNSLTVVIGGGAAGIVAAISKARRNEPVLICEKTTRIGKKLLVTGNGRCNLLNDDLDETYYIMSARELVKTVFARFGKNEILDFFRDLGLQVYNKDGRIFPITNQASTVLRILDLELKRLAVPIRYGFNCSDIVSSENTISVISDTGEKIECSKVIITGGGKTYPVTGSDGSIYKVAERLGHRIIDPVPAAVPLLVRDVLCQKLQGQRIQAVARLDTGEEGGEHAAGELLFTQYGLSGTCILDISRAISIALNREHKKRVGVKIDLVPFLSSDQLLRELRRRLTSGFGAGDMLTGILPDKLCVALRGLFLTGSLVDAVNSLKSYAFTVHGTRGWNEAEFTSGGVSISEINPYTLESKVNEKVYFAGEILDVDGKRGGYNLAWAWASGFVAGLTGTS